MHGSVGRALCRVAGTESVFNRHWLHSHSDLLLHNTSTVHITFSPPEKRTTEAKVSQWLNLLAETAHTSPVDGFSLCSTAAPDPPGSEDGRI